MLTMSVVTPLTFTTHVTLFLFLSMVFLLTIATIIYSRKINKIIKGKESIIFAELLFVLLKSIKKVKNIFGIDILVSNDSKLNKTIL